MVIFITKTTRSNKQIKSIPYLKLLGISVISAFIFMVVYFTLERWNITPWLNITYISGLTEGENWILFISSFILTFFIIEISGYLIYRSVKL